MNLRLSRMLGEKLCRIPVGRWYVQYITSTAQVRRDVCAPTQLSYLAKSTSTGYAVYERVRASGQVNGACRRMQIAKDCRRGKVTVHVRVSL